MTNTAQDPFRAVFFVANHYFLTGYDKRINRHKKDAH